MTRLFLVTPNRFIKPLIVSLTVVLAFILLFINSRITSPTAMAQTDATQPITPAATFNANPASLGPVPDGTGISPLPSYGLPRDVTFLVQGLTGSVSDVSVSFTFGNPQHTYRGDIEAVLKAPGGTPAFTLFSRTGATSPTNFGNGNHLAGPYVFTDSASGTHWWLAPGTPTPAGSYRTVEPGPSATTPPVTSLNAAFSSVPNVNGTWTLSFRDGSQLDTGSISAASLTLTTGVVAPTQHVVDFDGNGKTDFAVVRNTGGGLGGQMTWFIGLNGPGTTFASQWGISTDRFVPVDFDGDNKSDIAVWRSGAPTVAAFYILQSQTNTLRIDTFGQTGDDPTVVDDYDGDGKADVAVYRAGANAGDPSTWFYRGTLSNPSGNVTYVPWGQNGDFPISGDYDGDGKADFVVQRNNGGGQARFWMLQTTAGFNSVVFGTPTDPVVPGDYDGDGKTDLCVIRGVGGQIAWFLRPSSTGTISGAPTATFGASATDFAAQGDYDGDGKTDFAVWRPDATPGASSFWVLGSTSGASSIPFGQSADYPVANYNKH